VDCDHINENIDNAKQMSDDIGERLKSIVNQESINELSEKYIQKNKLIEDCSKLIEKGDRNL